MKPFVLFLTVFIYLVQPQSAFAKRAPNMRFTIEQDKNSHFKAIKGSAIFSKDSLFSHCDTVRTRFFTVENNKADWCEILTIRGMDWDLNCFWRIILYSKDDSLVSNSFKISSGYPKLNMKVGNDSLTISEEKEPEHWAKDFLLFFALLFGFKMLGVLLFSIWSGFSLRKFYGIVLLNLCSALIYSLLLSDPTLQGWMFAIILLLLFGLMLFASGKLFSIKEYLLLGCGPLLILFLLGSSDTFISAKTLWNIGIAAIWTTITYSEYMVLKKQILPDKKDTFVLVCNSLVSILALIIAFACYLITSPSE
jgi:hypothetical protein